MKESLELRALTEELREIARADGPLVADQVADAHALLGLARYQALPEASARQELLVTDILGYIEGIASGDDYHALRAFFRQDLVDLGWMDRTEKIAETVYKNSRLIRGEYGTQLLGELAFALYQRAVQPRGAIHRLVRADVTIHPEELDIRNIIWSFELEALRPNQRVYVYGYKPHDFDILSLDVLSEEDGGHVKLRDVPINADAPQDGRYLFIYYGSTLLVGQKTTVRIRECSRQLSPLNEGSIALTSHNAICPLQIIVDAPLTMANGYYRIRWDSPYEAAREEWSQRLLRDNADVMRYEEIADPTKKYELRWFKT